MANAGEPGTTGSQFFIVVSDTGLSSSARPALQVLGARHDGRSGLDVAQKINTFGSAERRGTPTKKVTVNEVTIADGRPRPRRPSTT